MRTLPFLEWESNRHTKVAELESGAGTLSNSNTPRQVCWVTPAKYEGITITH